MPQSVQQHERVPLRSVPPFEQPPPFRSDATSPGLHLSTGLGGSRAVSWQLWPRQANVRSAEVPPAHLCDLEAGLLKHAMFVTKDSLWVTGSGPTNRGVERRKTEGIKQRAGRRHKGNAVATASVTNSRRSWQECTSQDLRAPICLCDMLGLKPPVHSINLHVLSLLPPATTRTQRDTPSPVPHPSPCV
eukprot:264972-Chlamydomonas_euryale.AAC.2